MFPNLLTSSPWVWAGLIAAMVALPLLIHLINHLRYQRIPWAAIDFLMASHRRNRRKVWFRQGLLVASRIAALLLVLFSIAQTGCPSGRLNGWLGGSVTHHYVLLDDSYSMSETPGGPSAFDRCRDLLRVLAGQLSGTHDQRLTLMRFSQAQVAGQSANTADQATGLTVTALDVNGQLVDREFESQLDALLDRMEPAALACGPREAIERTGQLIRQASGETPVVYVLSDFRQKDWARATNIAAALDGLRDAGASLDLVRAAEKSAANLAVTGLSVESSVRVAGVPMMMSVSISNFSGETMRNIQVQVQSGIYGASRTTGASPELINVSVNELPSLLIEKIDPAETTTRRFPVFFEQAGQHAILVTLPADAIDIDNQRSIVIPVETSSRVLVAGNGSGDDTSIVSLALNPGGMTGIASVAATAATLRDATTQELAECDAIFLLNIQQIDRSTADRLFGYVEQGGGLVFFAGPDVDIPACNEVLYRKGQGIFPAELDRVVEIPVADDRQSPDITPARHPVWSHVLDVKNSPLELVQLGKILQPALAWSAEKDNVQVLATVRGQLLKPLVLEKKIGKGTVIAVLTTAGPGWNNWCRNGTFPASLLLIHEYVARNQNAIPIHLSGERIAIRGSREGRAAEYSIVVPGRQPMERTVWEKRATVPADDSSDSGFTGIASTESVRPGVYEIWTADEQGLSDIERMAVNVDTRESETEMLDAAALSGLASGSTDRVTVWSDFSPGSRSSQNSNLTRLLFMAVLLVMVAEHFLASVGSYR